MTSWNPCMSFSIDPMIVPSAAKTTAISAMNTNPSSTPPTSCGRNPAIRHTASTSVPWISRGRRPAERPADHDLDAAAPGRRASPSGTRTAGPTSRPTPEKIDENRIVIPTTPGATNWR